MVLDDILENGAMDSDSIGQLSGSTIKDANALIESFIYDTITSQGEEFTKQFLESAECKALEEAGVLGKKTIVRMTKIDDLSRRIKLAVLQKAKEDRDPNYLALKKVIAKKKALSAKLMAKYKGRVKNDAIKSQRALMKISPSYFTRPIR
jgi:hypothetical protein